MNQFNPKRTPLKYDARCQNMFRIIKIPFLLFLALQALIINAQENHTVNIVVPFVAGSAQDTFARLIAPALSKALASNVIILNKPGAGGTVGAAFVANSKPDGNTLLMAASNHHLAPLLYPRLPYHPFDSFRGVTFLGSSPYILVASSDTNFVDLKNFVKIVQQKPKFFNFGSSGTGSISHIAMSSFLIRSGLQMTHIPLKGSNEILNEMLAKRIDAAMLPIATLINYKSDDRIKLLAITDISRSTTMPELPTIWESGFQDFYWLSWTGLLAPANSPISKINTLSQSVASIIQDPSMQLQLQNMGLKFQPKERKNFEEFLRNDWVNTSILIDKIKPALE